MPGSNIFRPTPLKDAAFNAVRNASGLFPGGYSRISNPTTRIAVEVGALVLTATLTGCGPAAVEFLTGQGIPRENINDPWIFPNDGSNPKDALDNAKSVEFVMYTNPKDNLPYLALPIKNESGTTFEQRQVKLLYERNEVGSDMIGAVILVIADTEKPQENWWKDPNERTAVVNLKLKQPLIEDVLKQKTSNLTNDDIIGKDPLFSQLFAINPFTGEAVTVNFPPQSTDSVQNEVLAQKVALLVTGKAKLNDQPILIPTMSATKEAPTPIPTPAPVEVAPGEFVPASQIVGYEARDTSGKLIYVQDTHGNWIKASYEVTVAPATQEDWANVNARLGTDFVINTDGTITGVEGLNIDMANGEATFNGRGLETYHIGNMKAQEVNGEKRLLVAGYMWNAETTSWEVFNPGFPMEDPRTLGRFLEADIPNGNWLRWHQRATENIDMKALFAKAVRPTTWISVAIKSDRNWDYDFDGRKDVIHYGALWWLSPKLDEAFAKGEAGFLTKEQFPNRPCQSSAFLADMDAALFSNDMLNGDGSITSLPSAIDIPLIWERREVTDIFSTLAEGCNVDQAAIEAVGGRKSIGLTFTVWPTMTSYPDEEVMIWFTDENGQFLKDPAAIARREAVTNSNKLGQSASLDLWGAFIAPVEALQYWRIE